MKRFIETVGLLILIILIFSFVILRVLANSTGDNFFNSNYRQLFAQNQILRSIFGLHFDGDGRSDYLSNKYNSILVEVDTMEGLALPQESLDLLSEKIKSATGKNAVIINSDSIPYKEDIDEAEIKNIVDQYKNLQISGQAYIYILALSQSRQEPHLLGLTYQEYGIVLFENEIGTFTSANTETYPYYVESTALHEFGHQLGLSHNNEPKCLMNATADESHVVVESKQDVITDFCDYEKMLIML